MLLNICLQQGYWIAGILSAALLFLNLIAVLGYVFFARKQALETQRLADQGEMQAKAAQSLAEQGERTYESRVTTQIVESHTVSERAVPVNLGLAIRVDLLINVRILIVNLSRGVSRFCLRASSWFFTSGPFYEPLEPLYRGEEDFLSRPGEQLEGHFFVNVSDVLTAIIGGTELTPDTDLSPVVTYFAAHNFYVSTVVNYPDVPGREPEPTYEYYFVPNGRPAISSRDERGNDFIFIPGQWVPGRAHLNNL